MSTVANTIVLYGVFFLFFFFGGGCNIFNTISTYEWSSELLGVHESLAGGHDDAVDDVLFAPERRLRFHHHVVADATHGGVGAAATTTALVRKLHAARVVPERRTGGHRRVGLLTALLLLLLLLTGLGFDGRGHGARDQNQSDNERTGCEQERKKKQTNK